MDRRRTARGGGGGTGGGRGGNGDGVADTDRSLLLTSYNGYIVKELFPRC